VLNFLARLFQAARLVRPPGPGLDRLAGSTASPSRARMGARAVGAVSAVACLLSAGLWAAAQAQAPAAGATPPALPAQAGQLTVGLTRMPQLSNGAQGSHGLIVRLKEAAPHITTNPALLPLGDRMRRRDSERWRSVLRGSGLTATSGAREPAMRPSGRDTYVLDFGRLLSPEETERVAVRLRARPEVEWVAANTLEQRLQVSSDPLAAEQWWLRPVAGLNSSAQADRLRGVPGFFQAWQSGLAGMGLAAASGNGVSAVVAVLDTGITPHPDLVGRVLPGYDFVSDPLLANDGNGRDDDPSDPGDWVSAADRQQARFAACAEQRSSWHGTVIAGLVAANSDNGEGVAGIDRQARILPVRVAGKCGAAVADIVDGMRWAAGLPVAGVPLNLNPARIINISYGGAAACGYEYQAAVDELHSHGVVVVAAAGNDHGAVARPANCKGVVGVAALNRDGFKTHYSSFGNALAASGLATVGGDDGRSGAWRELLSDGGLVTVWNAGATGVGEAGYAKLFGTSFAAPLVSGTISLMLGVNPSLTSAQVIDGLRKTVRPHVVSSLIGECSESNPGRCICTLQTCGAGMLDTEQALRFAANPAGYVAPLRQAQQLDTPEIRRAVALGPDLPPNTTNTATALTAAAAGPGVAAPSTTAGAGGGAPAGGGGGANAWHVTLLLLLVSAALWAWRPAARARF
jgi:serine protease